MFKSSSHCQLAQSVAASTTVNGLPFSCLTLKLLRMTNASQLQHLQLGSRKLQVTQRQVSRKSQVFRGKFQVDSSQHKKSQASCKFQNEKRGRKAEGRERKGKRKEGTRGRRGGKGEGGIHTGTSFPLHALEIHKIRSHCPAYNKHCDSDPIHIWLLKEYASVLVLTITIILSICHSLPASSTHSQTICYFSTIQEIHLRQ